MSETMGSGLKKIIYVTDGGNKLGLGHVYQSMTFAKLLRDMADICFLTKSDASIVSKIRDAGFQVLKVSSDSDILDFLKIDKPDIVIIDKIDVDETLAKNIKNYQIKLVIFTNLTNANLYADIAVTADIGSNFKNVRFRDSHTKTLYFYGPKYWVFREDFHKLHDLNKNIPKTVNRILTIFGGGDPANLTTIVSKELLNLPEHIKIDAVIGASFENHDSLSRVLRKYKAVNRHIEVHQDIGYVAELMYKADLVIVSPGLSAFEALYVGSPIIVVPQDLLQQETYQGFFKVIDKESIGSLPKCIVNREFTYPNQGDIIRMNIAGGTEELIKAIIGDGIDVD